MAVPICPVTLMVNPLTHELRINTIVNSFGSMQEQRIVTDLPIGPRADGDGTLSTLVGQNVFRVGVPRLQYLTQPVVGNANLDNSARALWKFYRDRFYDATSGRTQFESFYWYNPIENSNYLTWTGETVSSGEDWKGDTVTNVHGRYRVRFEESNLTRTQIIRCLYAFELGLIEVIE